VEASSDGNIRTEGTGRVRKINGLNSRGYRTVGVKGRVYQVHALVALAFHGPMPEGLEVRHLDDVKTNNRPENLLYGTRSENRLDAVRNGGDFQSSKTHCPARHEYNEENTRYYRGKRHCRACDRARKSPQPVGATGRSTDVHE
jgi:hypothetical protein